MGDDDPRGVARIVADPLEELVSGLGGLWGAAPGDRIRSVMSGRELPFALVLLFALAVPSAGQVAFDHDRNQAVGATAGLASGAGISYQEIFPNAFGFRGALALWKLGDFSFVDAGISGLRVLNDDGRRRLYLIGGLSYWRSSDEETAEIFDDMRNLVETREFDDVDDSWSAGFGVGIELPLDDRTGFVLEGLFTYWDDTGDLLPLPQVGLHFMF